MPTWELWYIYNWAGLWRERGPLGPLLFCFDRKKSSVNKGQMLGVYSTFSPYFQIFLSRDRVGFSLMDFVTPKHSSKPKDKRTRVRVMYFSGFARLIYWTHCCF